MSETQSQWGVAWDTFMSTYIEKYHKQTDELITYHQFIQKLMLKGANWQNYDYQFRVDRAYSICQWDTVRSDLECDVYAINSQYNQKH